MQLTNSQYNKIMKGYSETQFRHQHQLEKRMKRIYAEIPRLKELSAEIPSASAALARATLKNDASEISDRQKHLSTLRKERDQLLQEGGYTQADISLEYTCPNCRDTGYLDPFTKCPCFHQAALQLFYEQSHLRLHMERENFENFNLRFYSDRINPQIEKSNRSYMQEVRDRYYKYAVEFQPGSPDLLIFGRSGVGKTFLTSCIAKEVLKKNFTVVYLSAIELFELAIAQFKDTEEEAADTSYYMDCDLLIIDDLGTENTSLYKTTHLFHVINSRRLNRRTTIISTNYTPDELEQMYSERVTSRLVGDYVAVPLFGDDIRLL